MNKYILNTEIQEFINNNLNSDLNKLILKGSNFNNVSTLELIEQIEAKKRSEKKLPTWFNCKNIYYPNKLNIEQTSSEVTAKYKSEVITGQSIIDLTGGFGVDSFYFSKEFKEVTLCEIDEYLSEIVCYNFTQLHIKNIKTLTEDGIRYLEQSRKKFDCIYIDPSRRHDQKGKVFFLKDCLPNVPEHLDLLFKHSKKIIIKTSPLLDLSIGINELKHVKAIHIVAVKNEVKELVWFLELDYNENIQIKTVNINSQNNEQFNFNLEEESATQGKFSEPLIYLYEPNAAILKSGAFNLVTKLLGVFKLHQHSHLYTSENLLDFPGRHFKIIYVINYNKKSIKKLGIKKANITTRNFPESVKQLRKKLNISDGGDIYLFFTTNINGNKVIINASKIN